MRLRDNYDWIVIGDHPGALLSGALVARLGLSVLILPTVSTPGGRSCLLSVSRSGQYRDPEPNTLMGVQPPRAGEGGLLGVCLEHLGLLPAEADRISVIEAAPQVVTPTTRFHLHAGADALRSEVLREFGASHGPGSGEEGWLAARAHAEPIIRDFWLGYPDRLTLDPAKKKKGEPTARSLEALASSLSRLKSAPRSESGWYSPGTRSSELAARLGAGDLPEIAAGLYCGVTGVADPDPRALDFLHAIASSASTGRFRGGLAAYRELLLRIAKRLGANIPEGVECRRVFVEAGRIVGVQASQGGNMIAATGAASGCSLEQLRRVVAVGRRSLFKRLKTSLQPTGWVFTVALTVHEEAIPPGLAYRTVWKERAAPALEIEVVSPTDYGLTERESRFVFARTVLPFSAETLAPGYQRLVAARMFRQLTELLPFLEFHVKRAFPDFRPEPGAAADSEFTEAYPFRALSEIPENLRGYAGEGVGSRSGIEGLFLMSGESFPRYGSLGGTVAALEGAAWIAHRCGLAGPMLHKSPGEKPYHRDPEVHPL